MKKIVLIVAIGCVIGFSCTKKEIPDALALLGLEYYPVKTGKFIVYAVDSIVYGELPHDTTVFSYQLKEKIADSFIDNEGKTAYRVERYKKKYNPNISYTDMAWSIKEVYMLNADNKSIQILENNTRYTKLIFPIQENASWNANAGNTIPQEMYTYQYVDLQESFSGKSYEKVLKVKQNNYVTLISHQNYEEKYAKGVGLVYKEITDVLSNNIDPKKPVLDRIESGLVYKQTILEYGYE